MTVMVYDRACSDVLSLADFNIPTFIFLTFHFKYNFFGGSEKNVDCMSLFLSACLHLHPM